MLSFLKNLFGLSGPRSPQGPTTFTQSVRIAAAPADLFPLVDWNDDRHLWRQLGHRVTGDGDDLCLHVNDIPDHRFELRIGDCEPPTRYLYRCEIVPMIGNLVWSNEQWQFEAVKGGRMTDATITVEAQFVPGLSPRQWRFEQSKMDISCHNAVAKLKLMAEEGLHSVRRASERLIV